MPARGMIHIMCSFLQQQQRNWESFVTRVAALQQSLQQQVEERHMRWRPLPLLLWRPVPGLFVWKAKRKDERKRHHSSLSLVANLLLDACTVVMPSHHV